MNLYILEYRKIYHQDNIDGEDGYIVGCFSSKEKAEQTLEKYMFVHDFKRENMLINKITLDITKKQKYVYVPGYKFSTLDSNGQYKNHHCAFFPMESKEKCLDYIDKLKQEEQYKPNNYKIFDDESKDGFYITTYTIDSIYI